MTELLKFVTDSENGFTFGQMTAIVVVAAALSIMYKRITSNNQSPLNRACQYLELRKRILSEIDDSNSKIRDYAVVLEYRAEKEIAKGLYQGDDPVSLFKRHPVLLTCGTVLLFAFLGAVAGGGIVTRLDVASYAFRAAFALGVCWLLDLLFLVIDVVVWPHLKNRLRKIRIIIDYFHTVIKRRSMIKRTSLLISEMAVLKESVNDAPGELVEITRGQFFRLVEMCDQSIVKLDSLVLLDLDLQFGDEENVAGAVPKWLYKWGNREAGRAITMFQSIRDEANRGIQYCNDLLRNE